MTFQFSTEDVHPRERLSYWRDVMGIVPHEIVSSAGPAFSGTVRSEMLADLMVSDFRCDPCEVTRTARNISRSDRDDYLLCIQMEGRSVFAQDEREAVTESGAFVLIDPRRPFAVSYQGRTTRSVSLTLPRRAIEARLAGATRLTALAMLASAPVAGLASGFLSMLPERAGALDAAAGSRLAEQALDLVAMAFAVEADAAVRMSSVRGAALLRLKAVIEARLCEPDLTPSAVAVAAGMSVRYANDLLAREETSIERYILHRRLERCRRALKDPAQAHRMIGEIAFSWGFSDLSHFGRRFRSAFGATPGDWRRQSLEDEAREVREDPSLAVSSGGRDT